MVAEQLRAQEERLRAEAQLSLKSASHEVVKEIETLSKRLPYLEVHWNRIQSATTTPDSVKEMSEVGREPRNALLQMRLDPILFT